MLGGLIIAIRILPFKSKGTNEYIKKNYFKYKYIKKMTKNLINLKRELNFLTLKTKVTFWLFLFAFVLALTSLALDEDLYSSSLLANFSFISVSNSTYSKRNYSFTQTDSPTQTKNVASSIVSVPAATQAKAFYDKNNKLNPDFVTGFADGEASFMVRMGEDSRYHSGWFIQPVFKIELHKKDEQLLNLIRAYFDGIGVIGNARNNCLSFTVSSLKQILSIVIPHFDQYPLITQKRNDYFIWKEIILKIQQREHLTREGLQGIINMRASLNLGLSDKLKAAFPDTIPVLRPCMQQKEVSMPFWVAGFTSAEGCFGAYESKSLTKIGFQIQLRFQLTQHSRDEELIKSLIAYFNCGLVRKRGTQAVDYRVERFSDLINKIVPFFKKYPILGVKSLDFDDFCKVVNLMEQKKHLTKEGLDKIRIIKAGMNQLRLDLED